MSDVKSGLVVDWKVCPQNIPVTGTFFEVSNHIVFDDERSEEDEKNS